MDDCGDSLDASEVPDVPTRIDHTVLGPATTPKDVDRVAEEALDLGTNVCVPPCYVQRVRTRLDDGPETTSGHSQESDDTDRGPTLVTVVGFPHGHEVTEVKVAEARRAERDGADELDVVIAVGRLLAGEDDAVHEDLAAVVDAVSVPVKAIVAAPLLDHEQLERASGIAADVGCSHVKTATGFNGGGATIEDVEVMAEHLPVKASGGIGSWAEARAMFEAGADRIGASSGDAIVREWRAATDREP